MINTGEVAGLIKALGGGGVSTSDISEAVSDYLDDHPELVTTVQDGSITYAKLDSSLKEKADDVSDLKNALNSLPNAANTDAEDVDLDFIDDNGNVIVRFEDGHIKTKEFDSENVLQSISDLDDEKLDTNQGSGNAGKTLVIDEDGAIIPGNVPSGGSEYIDAKNSSSASDLLFSDNNGNVIGQFSGGHIQTKNFSSADIVSGLNSAQTELHSISGIDYIKTFTYDPDESTKQTITGDFKAGDTILCHFSNAADDVTDISNTRWVTYSYLDGNGIEQTLGQERGYNFARFILPEDTTEIYGSFGTELLESGSTYNCKFLIYKLSGYKRQPHVVTVGSDGKRMFESVREAMDSFNDNNAYNTYEVWIYPGTYNIMEDFTDTEIRETGFKGLWVKNGVTLIGIGHREQIILHAELDPDDYDRDTIRNNISTLNMSGNCGLQNLTVTNRYLRYAVHDDHMSGFHQEQTRIVENCKFESLDAASGGIGQAAYGAGGHNNKKLIIRNCDLGQRLIIHNTQLMTVSMTAIVENSTAKQVTLTDNNNTGFTAKTRVEFNNCNFDYVLHDRTSNGTEPTMILCGTGTHNIKLDCEADTFYNFGDCVKFITNISAGQAVKLTGVRTPTATTSGDDIYGISIGYDGTYTYVQRQGYIADSVLGLTGLSVGDYVTLDSSGVVTATGATASNAIGFVECVAETGTAFIKLMF